MLAAGSPANAQSTIHVWNLPGEGDLYDGTHWLPTTPTPPLLEDIRIDNGGTAVADGLSPLRTDSGDAFSLENVRIGSRINVSDPANPSGHLLVRNLDLTIQQHLSIAHEVQPGTSNGSLEVRAGNGAAGNLNVAGPVVIGSSIGGSSAPSTGTFGSLTVDGNYHQTSFEDIRVGQGTLTVGGDMTGLDRLELYGTTTTPATASIGGRLVGRAGSSSNQLRVGYGESTGAIEIGAGLADFSFVSIGEQGGNGELRINAGGIQRDTFGGIVPGPALRVGMGSSAFPLSRGSAHIVGDTSLSRLSIADQANSEGTVTVQGDLVLDPLRRIGPTDGARVGVAPFGRAVGTLDVTGNMRGGLWAGVQEASSSFPRPPVEEMRGSINIGGDARIDRTFLVGANLSGGTDPVVGQVSIGGDAHFVAGGGSIRIGWSSSFNFPGGVDGRVSIGGDLTTSEPDAPGFFPASIEIGRNATGPAFGRLEADSISGPLHQIVLGDLAGGHGELLVRNGGIDFTGSRSGNRLLRIGNRLDGFGDADVSGDLINVRQVDIDGAGSRLILRNGRQFGGDLLAGLQTTGARVEADRYFFDLGTLELGAGNTLALRIAGSDRGSEYSAIDADTATLAGTLELDFTTAPQAGTYDLVRAAVLMGDFADIIVNGIDPSQISLSLTEDSAGGSLNQVLRLVVIPEPSTSLLLCLGLAALAGRGARRA